MILVKAITFLAHNLLFAIVGLAGIGFLLGFHELGHFLFCKLFNIRTPSFSIGFGPRLLAKKIGETEFALSAIPLGGYVEIAGSAEVGQGEQKEAHAKDKRSFAVKPYWQKLLVLFGGILFNLLFAYFALILLHLIGMPKTVPVIRTIQPESPAALYNLAPGDKIVAVNNQNIDNNLPKALELIAPLANQETTITVERGGQEMVIPITLGARKDASGKEVGTLGVTFEMAKTAGESFSEAIKKGIALTNSYILGTIRGFKNIFFKGEVSGVQGPVAIISLIMEGISQSFGVFLLLLALISVNLAIFNLIPLPILDGGQILYYTIEAIIGRPIPNKIREYIHIGSWLLVLALILYLSAQDIYRLIKPLLAKIMGKI
jgi:regulator of sigma E protease